MTNQEQTNPPRAYLRAMLFGRSRIESPHVVHSGRTTENLGERTARRKHAKAYKAAQRAARYGR